MRADFVGKPQRRRLPSWEFAPTVEAAPVEYWVYESCYRKEAVGHVGTCSYIKRSLRKSSKAGRWHGPFHTRQAAVNAGYATDRPFRWCSSCSLNPTQPTADFR